MQHRSAPAPDARGRIYRPLISLVIGLASALGPAAPTYAASAPPNFQVTPVITGLKNPTDFQFAADGRVFVAEKAGLIKVFDSLTDTTPTVFADLSTKVYKGPNDHGILGLALDPSFATNPYVYVLYTYDAPIGGERAALERCLPRSARLEHQWLCSQRAAGAAARGRQS